MTDTVTIPSEVWKSTLAKVDALAAEKEALVQQGIRDHGDWRSKLNFLEADYKAEVAALAAENERLRKAGDAMAKCIQPPAHGPSEYESEYDAWFAAKEGRDAK